MADAGDRVILDDETPITTQFGMSDEVYVKAIAAFEEADRAVYSVRAQLRAAEAERDAAQAAVDRACRAFHKELLVKFRREARRA